MSQLVEIRELRAQLAAAEKWNELRREDIINLGAEVGRLTAQLATARTALFEAERFMAYFSGETEGRFVGTGTPEKCLAQIRAALKGQQDSVLTSEAAILDAYSTPGLRRNNTETPHERTDANPPTDSDLAPAAKRPT